MDNKNNTLFTGEPEKMRLDTMLPDSLPMFMTDDSLHERLEISSDGVVVITELDADMTVMDEDEFEIDTDTARNILERVGKCFSRQLELSDDEDDEEDGEWHLELTNTVGDVFRFDGTVSESLGELSDYIRYWLEQEIGEELEYYDELLCFDGGDFGSDFVTGLTLNYTWTSAATDSSPEMRLEETLTIDGDTDTIRHVWQPVNGIRVAREYYIRGGVSGFLDSIDTELFYEPISGDPPNVVPNMDEKTEYELSVSFRDAVPMYFKGSYDRNNLPPRWSELIDKLLKFLSYYSDTEIFDSRIFNSRKRCDDDLIFISVEFEPDGQTYYYVTDDDSIVPGDKVIVPVGRNWSEKVVTVVKKEYFSRDKTPIEPERLKPVLGKAEDGNRGE